MDIQPVIVANSSNQAKGTSTPRLDETGLSNDVASPQSQVSLNLNEKGLPGFTDIDNDPSRILSTEEFEANRDLRLEQFRIMGEQESPNGPMLKLYSAMEAAEEIIAEKLPNLEHNSWGISVDANGEVVILDDDSLSENERDTITEALEELNIGSLAERFADDLIKIVELDRGSTGYSNNIGQYDISRGNFSEAINLRTMFQATRVNEMAESNIEYNLELFADQLSQRTNSKHLLTFEKPT